MSELHTIKVSFFAALREQLNCDELQLPITNALTVDQAKQQIIALNPTWEAALSNESLFTAVNHDIVESDFIINPSDELAFFPPVTGG